jgi:hypothetical protein
MDARVKPAHDGIETSTSGASPPPIAAGDRAIAHRLAFFVQRQERRARDAVPQRGAVGGERVDAVGVDGDADAFSELRAQRA